MAPDQDHTDARPRLSVAGLQKNHGQVRALKGIDLTVAPGEIVGVVGSNGAGKSTMVSVLTGASPATEGTMLLDGEPYAPNSPLDARVSGVSVVEQRFSVDGSLTVAEAVAGLGHGEEGELDPAKMEAAVDKARLLVAAVGVDLDPEARISSLMRAEQALVEVLRVMSEEPRLVLLDELVATFNDLEVALTHQILRHLTAQGTGIIYITHRIDEVRSLADRVVVLRDGRVAAAYRPREVTEADIVQAMFDHHDPIPAPPESAAAPGDVLLEAQQLSRGERVRGVSFQLRRGEVLGLTGLRQSGVAEVLSILAGGAGDYAGQVMIDGTPVRLDSADDAVGHGIAYLADTDDELEAAVEESVAKRLMGDDRGAQPQEGFAAEVRALREVVAQVQQLHIHTHDIQSSVGHLSGGDQQKITLARWMRKDCEILILNHPTRGLDIRSKAEIYRMLRELTDRGVAVLLVSSEMTELMQWCQRIAVMREGAVVSVQDASQATEDTLMSAAVGGQDAAPAPRAGHGRRSA